MIRARCWPGVRAPGFVRSNAKAAIGLPACGPLPPAAGTWLGAHCPIFAADGSARYDANGAPLERTMLVRSEDVEWTDIWNTVGLRGTASDQFALNDFFVRSDHSITREFDRECRETGPLYRMSAHTCYQVPRGARGSLRDNAVVQSNLAQA